MPRSEISRGRRRTLQLLAGGAALSILPACKSDAGWSGIDVTGTLPDLSFTMTRARDGKTVTEADYRGQVTALFFGFTFCPDICPMTLANLAIVADELGKRASDLSILFVTVDPARDTREVLTDYVSYFTPRATGLRGTENQLTSLTRRYKVTYRVGEGENYTVSHGKSVYLFDQTGAARVMLPDFETAEADTDGLAVDIRRLLDVNVS